MCQQVQFFPPSQQISLKLISLSTRSTAILFLRFVKFFVYIIKQWRIITAKELGRLRVDIYTNPIENLFPL